jgi:hypothetical protein
MIAVMDYKRLPVGLDEEMWQLYYEAMAPTRANAVQRHLLKRTEFDAIDWNKKFIKLVAFDETHQPTGLMAITNELNDYDLIEPEYFRKRWPDEFVRKAIWYVLFAVTAQYINPRIGAMTYTALIREVTDRVRKSKGVGGIDLSTARCERHMDRATYKLIKRDAPELVSDGSPADAQHFVIYEFNW